MSEIRIFERIHAAVSEGDADLSRDLARQSLAAGLDPAAILEQGYTRALQSVGSRWEAGDLFLPEMILAAEAMKAAMEILRPALGQRKGGARSESHCVLGTVRGDIHDIGKSIVTALLEASGFQVADLGTDVEPERFVSAIRETHAGFLGMSALLTTTMPQMKQVLDLLVSAGLRTSVRVAVGGAPVTREFAAEIGADGYAEDGLGAMRLFQKLETGTASRV